MSTERYDHLFQVIEELVMRHSPSGAEDDIDGRLLQRFSAHGHEVWRDAAENIIVRIPGKGKESIAITAHKDEIGAIVHALEPDGRIKVRKLGGAFPWVYGEGVVDLLGDHEVVSGILSFGSRHVSHESAQKALQDEAPLRWQDVWIETKYTHDELRAAGVRPGTRMVPGKHRKRPFRLKDHIASYTLDNKASLAILLDLARSLREPAAEVFLVASAKEEVGAMGALFLTRKIALDALIALEICPIAPEYAIRDGVEPVLLSEDGYGLYDEKLNGLIREAAAACHVPLQLATISGFGSDGSIAMRYGHVPRAACLGFATQNTHGYEIAHLGAIANCIDVLDAVCRDGVARLGS